VAVNINKVIEYVNKYISQNVSLEVILDGLEQISDYIEICIESIENDIAIELDAKRELK